MEKYRRGEPIFQLVVTDASAASLHRLGLEPLGRVRDDSGWPAIGADGQAHGVHPPLAERVVLTSGGSYFLDYPAIVEEMSSIASTHAKISFHQFDNPQNDYRTKEQQLISAIQFGPLGDVSSQDVPTVVVLATYHSNEWMSTAVAVGLYRAARDAVTHGGALETALQSAALLIVPVVNPDGYAYTRSGANRTWRRNRNLDDCAQGVDLNRNHGVGWTSGSDCTHGSEAVSEPETKAIEALLQRTLLPQLDPVAVLSYHSFGDLVLYPDGYKAETDEAGPACALNVGRRDRQRFCYNADHQLYRALYGDTEDHQIFFDGTENAWYYRDHSSTLLPDTSTGTINFFGQYGAKQGAGILTITPELPNATIGFFAENHPSVVANTISDQVGVIERVVAAAPGLGAGQAGQAYGPGSIGVFASGFGAREVLRDNSHQDARFSFLKPVWRASNQGRLRAKVDNVWYDYARRRDGAQYRLFALPEEAFDPLCPPCWVTTVDPDSEHPATVDSAGCTGCVDLCDENRLNASGWRLESGVRGRHNDCYWKPEQQFATLEIPAGLAPTHQGQSPSHCHLTFSALYDNGRLIVERQEGSGWREVFRYKFEPPYHYTTYPAPWKLLSFSFEANSRLSESPAMRPAFRIRVEEPGSETKIFDPVIYCRIGGLP